MVHINDNINQPPSHYIKILMSCPNEKIKIFNVLVGYSSAELLFSVTAPKGKNGIFLLESLCRSLCIQIPSEEL